jgi:hypothetical protein
LKFESKYNCDDTVWFDDAELGKVNKGRIHAIRATSTAPQNENDYCVLYQVIRLMYPEEWESPVICLDERDLYSDCKALLGTTALN